jgi:hypothetical protein
MSRLVVSSFLLLQVNKDNNSHVLKYYECFTHKNHLCLVSELREKFSCPFSRSKISALKVMSLAFLTRL